MNLNEQVTLGVFKKFFLEFFFKIGMKNRVPI